MNSMKLMKICKNKLTKNLGFPKNLANCQIKLSEMTGNFLNCQVELPVEIEFEFKSGIWPGTEHSRVAMSGSSKRPGHGDIAGSNNYTN